MATLEIFIFLSLCDIVVFPEIISKLSQFQNSQPNRLHDPRRRIRSQGRHIRGYQTACRACGLRSQYSAMTFSQAAFAAWAIVLQLPPLFSNC
jgi:hypothetical protein